MLPTSSLVVTFLLFLPFFVSGEPCEDAEGTFETKKKGTRDCKWANKRNPINKCKQKLLDGGTVKDVCPATCGECPETCCEVHPGFADPAHTTYIDCVEQEGQQEVTRLKWAVRYLRAAVGSKPFEKCLRTAVNEKYELTKSSDEHNYVGPYVPCNGTNQDPSFIFNWPNPKYLAYDVVMNTARFAGSTPKRKVEFECVGWDLFSSMFVYTENAWDYNSEDSWDSVKTHKIGVNVDKVMAKYPNHALDEDYWPNVFGVVGLNGYYTNGHSYPVDELAGMILHELLHLHNFDHGTSADSCGYDAYKCDDLPIPGEGSCRANSLNEIAEACASEVVEESIKNCNPEMCCHSYQVPVWVDSLSSCECESFW